MKYVLSLSIVITLLSACHQAELDKSNSEKDSLTLVVINRDSSINQFMSSFNDVERNLDSISLKQQIISVNANPHSEFKLSQKEHINSQIIAINKLMEENRKKLSDLSCKLKGATYKNAQLERTIATLNLQLVHKYVELTDLNEKLYALNAQVEQLHTSIDTLTLQGNQKTQSINSKTAQLHAAYYIIGKTKDLEKAKLIDKKGGLLGIGRTAKLNANLDNTLFACIDYTQTTSIPINSPNAKIISTHPSDSYQLEKDNKMIKNLLITDPEKFWSISKYLVIVN